MGSIVEVYSSIRTDRLLDDAIAICRAARDVGIRLSFVVPMRDQMTLGYAPDDDLLRRHDPRDHDLIRRTWLYPFPSPAEYMDVCESRRGGLRRPDGHDPVRTEQPLRLLAMRCSSDWRPHRPATGAAFRRICWRPTPSANGPTRPIKVASCAHLDELGLLSPRFSGAHGVWLRPDGLRSARRTRRRRSRSTPARTCGLRSGIAPVGQFIKSGLDFGIAIDSFSFDDDDDAFRELRLTHWLHSMSYAEHPLTPARLFGAALKAGFRIANNADGYGVIEPGAPADLVLLDYDAMAYDAMAGMVDELDLLLTRACNRFVERVYVAGREIVRDGKVLGIDFDAVEAELLARARAERAYMDAMRPVLKRSQATLEAFFKSGGHRAGE